MKPCDTFLSQCPCHPVGDMGYHCTAAKDGRRTHRINRCPAGRKEVAASDSASCSVGVPKVYKTVQASARSRRTRPWSARPAAPRAPLTDTTVQLCSILGGDTGAISALRILHLYMERLGCDFQVRSALLCLPPLCALHLASLAWCWCCFWLKEDPPLDAPALQARWTSFVCSSGAAPGLPAAYRTCHGTLCSHEPAHRPRASLPTLQDSVVLGKTAGDVLQQMAEAVHLPAFAFIVCALRSTVRFMQDSVALERTAGNALQLMAEAVYSPAFLDFRPSLVAAGVLTSSRKAAGVWPFWPSSLAQLTGVPSFWLKRWLSFHSMRSTCSFWD